MKVTATGPGEVTAAAPERKSTPAKAMVWYRWDGLPGYPGYQKIWDLVNRFNRTHPYLACMAGVDPGAMIYAELEGKVNACNGQAAP